MEFITMTEIPKAPIVRICKNAGAERIGDDASTVLTEAVEKYAEKLSEAAVDLATHADRKTVKPEDIELATKHFY